MEFTSKSVMVNGFDGCRFEFFCDLCDSSYTTGLIHACNDTEAITAAREEARRHFNLCHQCYKWVCDNHYNEDVMMCIHCAPKVEKHDDTSNNQ